MKTITVLLTIILIASTALTQQKVPPPPKPAPDGPSLEVTMKFIQDKLNDEGAVKFVLLRHNAEEGDIRRTVSQEISNVTTEPRKCQITYHVRGTYSSEGETATNDSDCDLSVGEVKNIVVIRGEQYLEEAVNHSDSVITIPKFLVLEMRLPKGEKCVAFLKDEDMANRVAKALVHAVELCGGGKKEAEPF